MTGDILTWLKAHKSELITLLSANDLYPKSREKPLERNNSFNLDKYAHMIKCQQCEHLTTTGYCRVKPQIKPIPDALRTCDKFNLLKGERGLIQGQKYTPSEINSLVERYEKPLFYHALDCSICNIEKAQYCLHGNKQGKAYNEALLLFEDAQARREDLALRIDRACISGRSVFVSIDHDNLPTPQQKPVISN